MPVSREVLRFQQNLRQTALGVKFGKQLFTAPETLSPSNITAAMRALGMNVSKDLQVTADIAQVLVSGQALYDGIQAGTALNDLGSTSNPSIAAVNVLTGVLHSNGMMDDESATNAALLTGVLMIVASGGTNIMAWISVAMNLAAISAGKAMHADALAIEDLNRKYEEVITPQFRVVGETFEAFQKGNLGIFGLITKIAAEAPNMWPQAVQQNSIIANAFPDIKLIPCVSQQLTGYGSDEMWGEWPWGERYVIQRWESEKSLDIESIGGNLGYSKEKAAAYIWQYLINPWTQVYEHVNNSMISQGHASVFHTAILSLMVGNDQEISSTVDYAGLLAAGKITPWDLNEPECIGRIVQAAINADGAKIDQTYKEAGLSTGYENPGLRSFYNTKVKGSLWTDKLRAAQNIQDFLRVPMFYDELKKYFQFPTMPFESRPTAMGKFTGTGWRQMQNYVSVINLCDQFRTDPYLAQTRFAAKIAPFIPSTQEFESEFKRIQMLAVARNCNTLAKNNIADFLGTKASKLKRITPPNMIGASKWTV